MKRYPLAMMGGVRRRAGRGFTLVEVLLGLALLGLLAGGIFAEQRGALTVSAEVAERETKVMRVHAFCELLRRTFEQAPGNARVNLMVYGGAGIPPGLPGGVPGGGPPGAAGGGPGGGRGPGGGGPGGGRGNGGGGRGNGGGGPPGGGFGGRGGGGR